VDAPMSERKRGTCVTCKVERDVVDGHVVAHERAYGWRGGVETHWRPCEGSNVRPAEARAKDRAKSQARRAAEIAKVRDDAAVALDSMIEGRSDFTAEHARLLKLAMQGWRLANPGHVGDPLGFTYKLRGNARRNGADCYCLFCGELIGVLPVKWRWHMHAGRVEFLKPFTAHVMKCALTYLAGMRDVAAAGTRKLPSQMTLGDDEL
jgi:hypothetical protein